MTRLVSLLDLISMLTDSAIKNIRLKELSTFRLADFASTTEHNNFIRQILDQLMQIQDSDTNKRRQFERVIAESVFSREENTVNLGLQLLKQAVETQDRKRQDFVINGYRCLEQDITRVDLNKVLPMLIKCRNITLAVMICSLKAQDLTQAQEAYLPALDLVQASLNTINKEKPQNEF